MGRRRRRRRIMGVGAGIEMIEMGWRSGTLLLASEWECVGILCERGSFMGMWYDETWMTHLMDSAVWTVLGSVALMFIVMSAGI